MSCVRASSCFFKPTDAELEAKKAVKEQEQADKAASRFGLRLLLKFRAQRQDPPLQLRCTTPLCTWLCARSTFAALRDLVCQPSSLHVHSCQAHTA